MKPLSILSVLLAVLCMTACGSKTGVTADPDSLFYADTVAVEEVTNPTADAANAIVALLQEQLESADLERVKGIAKDIASQLKNLLSQQDTEGVETYAAIISNFIAENSARIKEIGASEVLSEAITQVEGIPTDVVQTTNQAIDGVKSAALTAAISAITKGESVVDAVKAAADELMSEGSDAANKASNAVEAAKNAAENAPDEVKEAVKNKAEEVKEAVKQQATDAANQAIDDAAAAAKKALGL